MHKYLIVIAACLCMLRATAAPDAEPGIATTMRELIIPRIAVEEMPVAVFFDQLRALSRAADPAGAGLNMIYFPPPVGSPAARTESTITMEMRDIPVGEVIRYTCTGASIVLDYVVEEHAVLVFHPEHNPLPHFTRTYPLPYWISGTLAASPFSGPACLSTAAAAGTEVAVASVFSSEDEEPTEEERAAAEAEAKKARVALAVATELKAALEGFGVTFGPQTRVGYIADSRRLVVTNTAHELRKVEAILAAALKPIRHVQLDLTVIRVSDPAILRDRGAHALTLETLQALPPAQRQVLYRASLLTLPGQTTTNTDAQSTTVAGQPARLSHRAIVTGKLSEDERSLLISLDWSMRLATVDAPDDALVAAEIRTAFAGTATTPRVFAIQTEHDAAAQLFLVVRPDLLLSSGAPVPPEIEELP